MRRAGLLYALIFLSEAVFASLVPLTPHFRDEFGLTELEAGALLAGSGISMAAASIPLGVLTDRAGSREVTLAAGLVVAAATIAQGIAPGFWLLLGARIVFGVAFAAVWTAALVWITDAVDPDERARALSLATTVAGLGVMTGPGFAAVLVARVGVVTPFVVLALLAVATTVALFRLPRPEHVPRAHENVRAAVRASVRRPEVRAALAIMLLGGVAMSAINLLVPLELHANGVSTARIGLVYSASSAIFIAVSGYIARLGARAVTIAAAGAATLLLAGSLSLVVASVSTVALVTFLLIRAPISSTLFTIAYPLAGLGTRRTNAGRGSVMGLLNVVWATSTLIGPLMAGVLAQTAGVRSTYVVLIGVSLALGSAMLASDGNSNRPGA